MSDLISKFQGNKKFLSLYTNTDETDKFIFGQIIAADEDYAAILMVSPLGHYDGVLVKPREDFFRIDEDDKYVEKMKKLIDFSISEAFGAEISGDGVPMQALNIAKAKKKIVSIELLHSGYDDVCGFVESYNGNICAVKRVDTDGCEDGKTYINICDITQIAIDSEDEQRLLKLWNKNRG